MAIITKPTITKGQANEIDLSKSELALLSKVVNDSYFSDQTNWSKVIIQYKSAEGNQHEMMIFDASEASPKGNFEVSEKARDDWEVQSVKIMDFDGGYLKLERGDLTVADFDIALAAIVGVLLINVPYVSGGDRAIQSTGSVYGQTFQYPADFSLTEIKLLRMRDVLQDDDFNLQLVVKDGVGGSIVGSSDKVHVSSLPSDYGPVSFTFSTPLNLTAFTEYQFIFTIVDIVTEASNSTVVSYNSSGNYSDGYATVNDTPQGQDHPFELYGSVL